MEVLQNLVDNAVNFMGHQAHPRIEIGAAEEGAEVVCLVRDNGIGIAPKYHETVFGLFNQLDPSVEGSGIGLALSHRIAEAHGGRMWVESAGRGQGSTFFFALPRQEASGDERQVCRCSRGSGLVESLIDGAAGELPRAARVDVLLHATAVRQLRGIATSHVAPEARRRRAHPSPCRG